MGSLEDGAAVVILGALVVLAVFVWVILGTLVGAFTGWILMLVGVAPWVYDGFAQFGFHLTCLWQVGAAFGFLGGFVKASLECKEHKD